MKADTHPKYFKATGVKCSCGAQYSFGTTKEGLLIEICANCHPFWTGAEKIIDTAGRVEKFKMRKAAAVATPKKTKAPRNSKSDVEETISSVEATS